MKKRFLVASAAIAMLLAVGVSAHKAAVDEDENASVPKIEDPTVTQSEESYIENIQKPKEGEEVYTGPKDFAYCKNQIW